MKMKKMLLKVKTRIVNGVYEPEEEEETTESSVESVAYIFSQSPSPPIGKVRILSWPGTLATR